MIYSIVYGMHLIYFFLSFLPSPFPLTLPLSVSVSFLFPFPFPLTGGLCDFADKCSKPPLCDVSLFSGSVSWYIRPPIRGDCPPLGASRWVKPPICNDRPPLGARRR